MNISSLVIDAQPGRVDDVHRALAQLPGVQIHAASPQGKLIVTVETDGDADTTERFTQINALDGVMSAAMVYHQFEPEPAQEA